MKKKNNKGITLVELIVTVTILAIIVAPLLRAFVISAQTNAKAKERLQATDLAQNIMEGLEAYGVDDISKQMNFTGFQMLDGSSAATAACELNYSESKYSVARTTETESELDFVITLKPTSSTRYDAATNTYNFVGTQNANGCYYFALGGLTSGGKSYDALITATPSAASVGGMDINSVDLAQISAISSDTSYVAAYTYSDAINDQSSISSEWDGKVSDNLGHSNLAYASYKNQIQRTVTISLDGDTDIRTINIKYSYELRSPYTTDSGQTILFERSVTAFDSMGDDSVHLEDFYFLFYPWYNGNNAVADNIVINNPKNFEADIILAEQKKYDGDTRDEASSDRYSVKVSVVESAETTGSMSDHTHVNIRPSISEATNVWWARCQYPSTVFTLVDSTCMTDSLVEHSSQGRIFDVTIKIYSAGTLFEGTDFNTAFSDSDEPYITFTGGLVY